VVIAVVLVLSTIPTLIAGAADRSLPPPRAPRRPLAQSVREFIRPLHSGDFAWVIFTRALMTGGVWAIFPFLFYFFRDVVHVSHADQFQSIWLLVVLLAATPFGIFGGAISDRYGRKKFVYASGALQSIVALVFIVLYPTAIPLVIGVGIVYGVGYGLYYAVDWALACDTLPDRSKSAKDMGLFHVAVTLPQTIVPGIAGPVLAGFNSHSPNSGYRVVFASAIGFFILGTILVSRIRSVR
jgi:MFS family permease